MFGPPKPTVRSYCERDASGRLPVLEEDEEILYTLNDVTICIRKAADDDDDEGDNDVTESDRTAADDDDDDDEDDVMVTENGDGNINSTAAAVAMIPLSAPSPPGHLVVTSKRIIWLGASEVGAAGGGGGGGRDSDGDGGGGGGYGQYEGNDAYDFDVPYICLHAISRDPGTYPIPCIYCQLDTGDEEGGGGGGDDALKEVFFAPLLEESLTVMFGAFSKAAELNPDIVDGGEDDEDDELIYDDKGLAGLDDDQMRVLEHLDEVLVVESRLNSVETAAEGQFDDADEREVEAGVEVGTPMDDVDTAVADVDVDVEVDNSSSTTVTSDDGGGGGADEEQWEEARARRKGEA